MRKKIVEETAKIRAPVKHARFIVRGGDYNPIGYRCNGLEIMRTHGESTEELRTRSKNAVEWPSIETVHTFIPL